MLAVGVLVLAGACGSRAGAATTNQELLQPLSDLPGARPVAVEHYGYDLGNGEAANDFFTEMEFEVADGAASPATVIESVERRLGSDWEMAGQLGDGDAMVATFANGDARLSVTTWDGGFDITVAADGAKLDGTPLAL